MTKYVLPVLLIMFAPALAVAQSTTVEEVTATILENNRYLNETGTGMPDSYSSEGALEFWSSGGLMNEVSNRDEDDFEFVNVRVKHLKVIPLVEGQAAVAHYYSEGMMKPKGFPAVSHYLTRASQVFVKEGDRWVVRSSHWSPVVAGSGTSQSVQ